MARLTALPSVDIIRGFKGVLDFYMWKGLPCVRSWPRRAPGRQTDAEIASALLFGQIIKNYRLLADMVLVAYQEIAAGTPRTARDVYVSGAYGHLHEASMSDFLTLLTNCRDSLLALEALLGALHDVGADEIDTNVVWSALPAGAASAAHQVTQITALQKIDDLQDALEAVALDRILVRGMDQLHTFQGTLAITRVAAISGANGYLDSAGCTDGFIWHVTNIAFMDITSPTTRLEVYTHHDAVSHSFHTETRAVPAGQFWSWSGDLWLDPFDAVRAYFLGGLVADQCQIILTGEIMTLET